MVLLAACGLPAPRNGELVTQSVARARFEVRAGGTDLVPVTVYFRAAPDGRPEPGPKPGLVLIQGGFVETRRYSWLAAALADEGFVVAVPENELMLAFFSVGAGEAARELLVAPPKGSLLEGLVDGERLGVTGHSLGSVVALKLALQGNFDAVALQAGFPDPADEAQLPGFTKPSLSLAGEQDCSAKLDGVREGWAKLSAPTALVVLPGVTHFQFTNEDDEDVQRGCPPTRSLDEAHADMRQALAAFFRAALQDGTVGEPGLRAVRGAQVEVR